MVQNDSKYITRSEPVVKTFFFVSLISKGHSTEFKHCAYKILDFNKIPCINFNSLYW